MIFTTKLKCFQNKYTLEMSPHNLKPDDLVKATDYISRDSSRDLEPLDEDDAYQLLNLFGFNDYVLDNLLNGTERSMFQRLFDMDIVDVREESVALHTVKNGEFISGESMRTE